MHKSSSDRERLIVLERCAVVALGMYLLGVGLNAIISGRVIYLNYLHWPVAAPVAVVTGCVLIIIGVLLRHG